MRPLIVIPARLASTRLPRKLLLRETGQSLIEHTYRAASTSRRAASVIVAADDPEIVAAVTAFGGRVEMTRSEHPSGTDRVAEVAARHPEFDCIVNVQGDEPEIEGATIDAAIAALESHPSAALATVAVPLRDPQLWSDPACVKVVLSSQGTALYFSRSPIPFPRDPQHSLTGSQPGPFWQHVGLYVYRPEFLRAFTEWEVSPLERTESLEQLRALERGQIIAVAPVAAAAKGIDTPADYRAFVERQRARPRT